MFLAGTSALLQDKGHSKTTDRLAMTFYFLRLTAQQNTKNYLLSLLLPFSFASSSSASRRKMMRPDF